eukprot:scaffold1602_cov249-Chaetoceros_neogracile.AAC.8
MRLPSRQWSIILVHRHRRLLLNYMYPEAENPNTEAIRVFWQSATSQDVWMKRAQANINDSHNKYLSDLSRIADVRYVPTEYDILISRVRTTQITVERYMIESIEFEVYDVDGQRSERKNGWIALKMWTLSSL